MNTRYIKIDSVDSDNKHKQIEYEYAAEILKEGGIVAFPTETVYGLGADIFNSDAVKKIFYAKGRPQDNPLIVHIWSLKQLDILVENISENAKKIMDNFWPGPVTIIFKKKKDLDIREVTAGLNTVAVRMPDNPVALKLIQMSGKLIAAPSANLSGKPSPTSGKHVLRDLAGKVDVIIDAGKSKVGVESTVIDCTKNIPVILRPGGITKEQIEKIIGRIDLDAALIDKSTKPISPGMKYMHYAPDGKMYLVSGNNPVKIIDKIKIEALKKYELGNKVAIIVFEENLSLLEKLPFNIFSLGSRDNLSIAASKIYGILRNCDNYKIDYIYSEGCLYEGLGLAVMNRLEKAAGGRIIDVNN